MADTTVCFGDYELDFARRELRRSGAPVDVQLTPLRVLLYLAEHRERTVPRRELLDAIWPGVVVGDEALTTALGHARQAVGDGGDAQRVIRTLKGQGYRFVAEVRAGEPAPHEPAPPSRRGERALTAILSGDIAGYSRLIAEDEDGTIRTLRAWREQVGALVPEHHGQLVDFTGDNFLAEFPAARAAVECAVEIQRVLAARNAALPPERRLHFRIGLHLGDVRREEGRLYGDGVNIAARLQQLAEPGGLCLSGAVVEQVRGKLALEFDDLGEQTLKNIPHPVRTWRPRSPAAEGVPARPAIAVLPFDNFSADPAQAFFADGLAEDLITRLSSFRSFPVIARTSSFQYRGGGIDVKRVGQELGARYLVEGSVRRSGERIRVSAQLIDAASGEQLWSDTYDREVAEVFELQDDISATIAASMTGNLGRAEAARARQRDPGDLEAWGLYQLGLRTSTAPRGKTLAEAARSSSRRSRAILASPSPTRISPTRS